MRDNDKRKVGSEEQKDIHNLAFLSKTAVGFLELSPDDDIYQSIGEQLKKLAGDSVIFVSSFDSATDKASVRTALGLGKKVEAMAGMLGRHPVGTSLPISEEARLGLSSGKLEKVPGGFYEFSFRRIPKTVCHAIEKLLDLGNIYATGFAWKGNLFGSASILTRKGTKLRNQTLIEAFIKQASVALQRRQAEEALQKAHEQLEIRVKERTKELAQANKQLRAEITERKQAKEALRESEERYRAVFENTGTATIIVEQDTTISLVNAEFEELSGYSREEIVGEKNWTKFVARKDDLEKMKQYHQLRRIDPDAVPKRYESKLIDKRGEVKDILITIDLIPGTKRSVASILDITERKHNEKALRESEEQYRDLFENANDLIQSVKPDGRFLYVNRAWRKTLGYTKKEIDGLSLFDIIHPDSQAHCMEVLQHVLSGESVRGVEAIFVSKEGKKITVEGSVSCRFVDGKPVATRGIFRDITERKKMEDRMQKLYQKEKKHRQELEEEKRVRGRSINVLAHELKTPLTPLLASAMLLKDILPTDEDRPEHELTDLIISGAETLATRLDELLDLARYTVGAFTITPLPMDILVTIKKIARQNRGLVKRKKQSIVLDLPQETLLVNGDRFRLEQVLTNLISNATKFSPEESSITIRAKTKRNKVVIEVEDRGDRLSEEEQERIFLPYHRVEQDRQRFDGLGLGLAICKQIVEAHRGKIWVESRPGHGSRFSFTLPALDKLPPD